MTTIKNEVFIGLYHEVLFSGGINLWWGRIEIWWRDFSRWGGMSKFLASGEDFSPSSQ